MLDAPTYFNPLDRGNLYQITKKTAQKVIANNVLFQSPRSGKFVSDLHGMIRIAME